MKFFSITEKIIAFFNWFVDFLAKPLGITTYSIALILGAVYYGDVEREKALESNKAQTLADGTRIKQLENKIDTLSNRLVNRDCSGEVQKYISLIQTLQEQTSQTKYDSQKRLELEKKKTLELENLKKSLNTQ